MATKKTFGASDIDDTMVTIYTVPDHRIAECVLVYITNPGSNNADFHLEMYDDSESSTFVILDGYTINAKDFLKIGGNSTDFIMMETGDQLKAYGENNSNFSVLMSVIEHNSNR